jgi:hypothetical protein
MNIKQPNRKKHSYLQKLHAPPEDVFPLLCPVMEAEWVPDWMPELVISQSGICEQDCVFITPPEITSKSERSIWIVTNYNPGSWMLEMYKVTPEHTVSKLEISLTDNSDNTTKAHISYEITALGVTGDKFLTEFTEQWYERFMLEWEAQINYYLDTGNMLA